MALWDDLDGALRANNSQRVAALMTSASEKERRACWNQIAAIELYRHDMPYYDCDAAVKLAIAGAAPTATSLADRYWRGVGDVDTDKLAAALLVARDLPWLAEVPAKLLDQESVLTARFLYELIRIGAVERPDDVGYLRSLVVARYRRRESLRSWLAGDPQLLEREVYELFADEECGLRLGSIDPWATGSDARTQGHDGKDESWALVIRDLAASGHLDRQRLLDLALGALARGVTWKRKRWYAGFLDLSNPTIDEMTDRAGLYLVLLTAEDSSTVAIGQAAVERLMAKGALHPDELLPVAEAPLLLKEKAVALRQLRLLEKLAADPTWTSDAVRAMAVAFGHPRRDVQERAVRLVGTHLVGVPAEVADEVRAAAAMCAPSLRDEVTAALGLSSDEVEAAVARPIAWQPPPPPALPPPLVDDDAFVESAVLLMARNRDPLLFERVLEGLLDRADRDPAELAEALAPAVAAARKALRGHDVLRRVIAIAVLILVAEDSGRGIRGHQGSHPAFLLFRRCDDVLQALRDRKRGPLLSMPTDVTGRIDPKVLLEREESLGEELDRAPSDLRLARLRAHPEAWQLFNAVLPGWRSPATYRLDPSMGHWYQSALAESWPLLWPGAPEHAVSFAMPALVKDVEHEPTSWEPSVLAPLLDWMSRPTVPAGDWSAAALALGLGSRVALNRAAAGDCLLALAYDRRIAAESVGACALAAAAARTIKLSRVATALRDILADDPELVRDVALEIGPALITNKSRDAHLFLAVAADAVAQAGPVPLPPIIKETATRKGSSKLTTEARRLMP